MKRWRTKDGRGWEEGRGGEGREEEEGAAGRGAFSEGERQKRRASIKPKAECVRLAAKERLTDWAKEGERQRETEGGGTGGE